MRRSSDEDALPVIVPRSDKVLVPTSQERVRRLRDHLASVMVRTNGEGAACRPGPEGFAADVARAACTLCRGWCCRNGDNDAFLDESTLARVCHARPELDAEAVLHLYAERVPAVGYKDSCIFHGEKGCTLDRTLRSDVCNSYFCGGLQAYMSSGDVTTPVVIMAGESNEMRTSPVLMPQRTARPT
jgi:hypothetical protein